MTETTVLGSDAETKSQVTLEPIQKPTKIPNFLKKVSCLPAEIKTAECNRGRAFSLT